MKTDLSHYKQTALVVINQLDVTVGATSSKVARALKLSRYMAKKLVSALWDEGLIGINERGLFVTDKGGFSMTETDKIRAIWHLDMIHGIERNV